MKKNTLILAAFFVLVISLGVFWYLGAGTDVRIVDMSATPLEYGGVGTLNLILQNNENKLVTVDLEVENAFVDENGVAHSTSRLIITDYQNPRSVYEEPDYTPLQKPLVLLPGNNTVQLMLGYQQIGNYEVGVKVSRQGKLLDESSLLVDIPAPELDLSFEYEKEDAEDFVVYRIYAYLLNQGSSPTGEVPINLTVTNLRTGAEVLNTKSVNGARAHDKTSLRTWQDRPFAIVEFVENRSSGRSYMPVQNFVRGQKEDLFLLNLTGKWKDQTFSTELLLPPEGDFEELEKVAEKKVENKAENKVENKVENKAEKSSEGGIL